MIRVFNVHKAYDHHTTVLTALTFHIAKGEMVFLTGPSGAGKTTLLRLLYGAERPDGGQIIVNGRNIARLQHRHLPLLRRSLGLVFQDFRLLPELCTVSPQWRGGVVYISGWTSAVALHWRTFSTTPTTVAVYHGSAG
jgi:ABC-type ATPase involved in cell division